jgi:hypothetical protein
MVIRMRIEKADISLELVFLVFDFHRWGMLKKPVFCMFFNFRRFAKIQYGRDSGLDFCTDGRHLGVYQAFFFLQKMST